MRIVISGGGTGGHIYPALAIADEIKRRRADADFLYIGSEDGMEASIVAGAGYDFRTTKISGISRISRLEAAKAVARIPGALRDAMALLNDFDPHMVIGTGGYVSYPVLLAGIIMRKKTFVHEQNALPGLTNRRLAPRVDCVFLTFAEALKYMKPRQYVLSGFPVRREIGHRSQREARVDIGLSPELFTVLVFGGSLGAMSINCAILELVARKKLPPGIQILWASGTANYQYMLQELEGSIGLTNMGPVVLKEYIHDMPAALAAADMVICRSGAGTISEVALAGLPAILVPYPYAAEDHQRKNAQAVAGTGAAVMITDSELSGGRLLEYIELLYNGPDKLEHMSRQMLAQARPDALDVIVDSLLESVSDIK